MFYNGHIDATGGILFTKSANEYKPGVMFDNVTLESNFTIPATWNELHMAGHLVGGKTLNLAGHTITIKNSSFKFFQADTQNNQSISPAGTVGYGTLIKPIGGSPPSFVDVNAVSLSVFELPF
jgi:hypothetical protein